MGCISAHPSQARWPPSRYLRIARGSTRPTVSRLRLGGTVRRLGRSQRTRLEGRYPCALRHLTAEQSGIRAGAGSLLELVDREEILAGSGVEIRIEPAPLMFLRRGYLRAASRPTQPTQRRQDRQAESPTPGRAATSAGHRTGPRSRFWPSQLWSWQRCGSHARKDC